MQPPAGALLDELADAAGLGTEERCPGDRGQARYDQPEDDPERLTERVREGGCELDALLDVAKDLFHGFPSFQPARILLLRPHDRAEALAHPVDQPLSLILLDRRRCEAD